MTQAAALVAALSVLLTLLSRRPLALVAGIVLLGLSGAVPTADLVGRETIGEVARSHTSNGPGSSSVQSSSQLSPSPSSVSRASCPSESSQPPRSESRSASASRRHSYSSPSTRCSWRRRSRWSCEPSAGSRLPACRFCSAHRLPRMSRSRASRTSGPTGPRRRGARARLPPAVQPPRHRHRVVVAARGWLAKALAATLLTLAGLFAVIGLWQAYTRELFFAPTLEVANSYTTFFRVTSVFRDPSLYGRHLVLAIAPCWCSCCAASCASLRRAGDRVLLDRALLLVLASRAWSRSSSSPAASRSSRATGGRGSVVAAAGAIALVGAIVLVTATNDSPVDKLTRGRSTLVSDTAGVFARHPLVGVGIGAQPRAAADEPERRASRLSGVAHRAAHGRCRARPHRGRRLPGAARCWLHSSAPRGGRSRRWG